VRRRAISYPCAGVQKAQQGSAHRRAERSGVDFNASSARFPTFQPLQPNDAPPSSALSCRGYLTCSVHRRRSASASKGTREPYFDMRPPTRIGLVCFCQNEHRFRTLPAWPPCRNRWQMNPSYATIDPLVGAIPLALERQPAWNPRTTKGSRKLNTDPETLLALGRNLKARCPSQPVSPSMLLPRLLRQGPRLPMPPSRAH
jgi:hypothetical protein